MTKKVNKNLNVSERTSVDNKLTAASLHLNYAFEYGVDFKNRVITLTGEIVHGWFDVVDVALTQMERDSKATVTIKINSPGGETYEAMAVVGRLTSSKCHIVTEGYGHVMSAATLILACGSKRRMSKYAYFMWHEAGYDPGYDRVSTHKATQKQIEREEKLWCQTMAEFSKKNEKFWKETGTHVDAYFNADQLLKYGAIDEVI